MPQKTLDDILNRIQSPPNQPMGKATNYPGVPDDTYDDNYTTHRQADDFDTRSQQPTESNSNEDYGVKTPSGKELLVDAEEEEDKEIKKALESVMNEQGEDEKRGTEGGTETGKENMPDEPAPTSKGKSEENEEYSSTEIGRVYELKKIYSRLISIEGYLNVSNDEELMKLRNYTIQAIDLFKTLVYNLDKFMDEVDDIIVYYYNFLLKIYETIRKRLKQIENEGEE